MAKTILIAASVSFFAAVLMSRVADPSPTPVRISAQAHAATSAAR